MCERERGRETGRERRQKIMGETMERQKDKTGGKGVRGTVYGRERERDRDRERKWDKEGKGWKEKGVKTKRDCGYGGERATL